MISFRKLNRSPKAITISSFKYHNQKPILSDELYTYCRSIEDVAMVNSNMLGCKVSILKSLSISYPTSQAICHSTCKSCDCLVVDEVKHAMNISHNDDSKNRISDFIVGRIALRKALVNLCIQNNYNVCDFIGHPILKNSYGAPNLPTGLIGRYIYIFMHACVHKYT